MIFGVNKEKKKLPFERDGQSGFSQLKRGLSKTRKGFFSRLASWFSAASDLDAQTIEEIEDMLLLADVGRHTTQAIIQCLQEKKAQLTDDDMVMTALKEILLRQIEPIQNTLHFPGHTPKPDVILMVGANGAGKTTTIGKLSHYLIKKDKKVQLAAGDTFRAAAIEQLQEWGRRNNIVVTAQKSGADAGAVIYSALQSARANHADIVIADTAGRLHTNNNLMEELKKIRRTINKFDVHTHCEAVLLLEAGIGQSALVQAQAFDAAIGIDGIILTKLDGTAKGGIIFPLANELKKPIYFIGIGEQLDDLRPFVAGDFVDALFM